MTDRELPEVDGYAWADEFDGGCFVYAHDVRPTSANGVYYVATVRRLIAEAVAAEREACAMVCVHLHNQGFDDLTASPTNVCASVIRARATDLGKQGGDKP